MTAGVAQLKFLPGAIPYNHPLIGIHMNGYEDDSDELSDNDESSDNGGRLDDLEQRIEKLESEDHRTEAGLSVGYAMGMSLAIVLSWSRNASILWCMLHGLLSWGYVIYFAVTQ